MITLLDKCIESLGKENIVILSPQETKKIFETFENTFPITWTMIDWDMVKKKITINSADEVFSCLERLKQNVDHSVFILWDGASRPVIKADLNRIISVIDDVTAVSFDTWLLCLTSNYVVEFYHEGEITVGLAPEPFELKPYFEEQEKLKKRRSRSVSK